MYLTYESDEEIKHGEDEDAEIQYEEMLLAAGAITETRAQEETRLAKEAIEKARAAEKLALEMKMIICSCGSPKCFAIKRFGLVKPKFLEHTEPIGCQATRDKTAERMKAYG